MAGTELGGEFKPIFVRHIEVKDCNVDMICADDRKRLVSARRLDTSPVRLECCNRLPGHNTGQLTVVYNQDFYRHLITRKFNLAQLGAGA